MIGKLVSEEKTLKVVKEEHYQYICRSENDDGTFDVVKVPYGLVGEDKKYTLEEV